MATSSRLTRSTSDRMIGGVCGGLAEFFGVDSTIVRVVFVLFAAFGAGVFVYLAMWLIVPTADTVAAEPKDVVREGARDIRDTAEKAGRAIGDAFRGDGR